MEQLRNHTVHCLLTIFIKADSQHLERIPNKYKYESKCHPTVRNLDLHKRIQTTSISKVHCFVRIIPKRQKINEDESLAAKRVLVLLQTHHLSASTLLLERL